MNVFKLSYGIECVCVRVGARANLCLCVNVLCLFLCGRLCVTTNPGYRTMSLLSFSHSWNINIIYSTHTNWSGLFCWGRKNWWCLFVVVVMHIRNDNEHKMSKFVMWCMNTWLARIHNECLYVCIYVIWWVGRSFFLDFSSWCFFSGPGPIESILCKSMHKN